MMKFESLSAENGMKLKDKTNSTLFGIRDGFWIEKEKFKNNSFCIENGSDNRYNFHDQQYPLIGKPKNGKFTPKRITVIQMI